MNQKVIDPCLWPFVNSLFLNKSDRLPHFRIWMGIKKEKLIILENHFTHATKHIGFVHSFLFILFNFGPRPGRRSARESSVACGCLRFLFDVQRNLENGHVRYPALHSPISRASVSMSENVCLASKSIQAQETQPRSPFPVTALWRR